MQGDNGSKVSMFSAESIPDDLNNTIPDEYLESIDSAILAAYSPSLENPRTDLRRSKRLRIMPPSFSCPHSQAPRSFSLAPCPRNPSFKSSDEAMLKSKCQPLKFGGQIVYGRTVAEVEKGTRELQDIVDAIKKDNGGQAILGFDIEWRPSFRKGVPPGKVAVVQICPGNSHCYVLHIIHSGIPQILQSLLEDASSIKVGAGIKGDSVKLFKDYNVSIRTLDELSDLANQKLGGHPKTWGLASLCDAVISKELMKPTKIKLGNWGKECLSENQLQYAATDAYASWFLYEVLRNFPDADQINEDWEV